MKKRILALCLVVGLVVCSLSAESQNTINLTRDERQFMVNLSTSILDDFGFKAGMNVSELTKTKGTPNIWDYGNDKHAGFNVFSVKAPHPNPFFSEYGVIADSDGFIQGYVCQAKGSSPTKAYILGVSSSFALGDPTASDDGFAVWENILSNDFHYYTVVSGTDAWITFCTMSEEAFKAD
jgi:hypothetical protein